eukprot:jgi/Tetstr1/455834/TSEL_042626.t1
MEQHASLSSAPAPCQSFAGLLDATDELDAELEDPSSESAPAQEASRSGPIVTAAAATSTVAIAMSSPRRQQLQVNTPFSRAYYRDIEAPNVQACSSGSATSGAEALRRLWGWQR